VALFALPEYLAGAQGGNFVLAGSDQPIEVARVEEAIATRGGVELGVTGDALARFVDGSRPLVDDFAPVDQMLSGL
jgi:hypothetical protein